MNVKKINWLYGALGNSPANVRSVGINPEYIVTASLVVTPEGNAYAELTMTNGQSLSLHVTEVEEWTAVIPRTR